MAPRVRRTARWIGLVAVLGGALASCSDGGPQASPTRSSSPGSSTPSPGSTGAPPSPTSSTGEQAFFTRAVSWYGGNESVRTGTLTVHPALRADGKLFIPLDLRLDGSSDDVLGSDYFCFTGTLCQDLAGLSLVDVNKATRYGPLRATSATGEVLGSTTKISSRAGVTYRMGVWFPDPAGSPATLDLDTLSAGTVSGLPVVEGPPPTDLLEGAAGGSPSTSASDVEVLPAPSCRRRSSWTSTRSTSRSWAGPSARDRERTAPWSRSMRTCCSPSTPRRSAPGRLPCSPGLRRS